MTSNFDVSCLEIVHEGLNEYFYQIFTILDIRREKSMMIIMENDLKKETTKLKSYIYIIIDIYNFI